MSVPRALSPVPILIFSVWPFITNAVYRTTLPLLLGRNWLVGLPLVLIGYGVCITAAIKYPGAKKTRLLFAVSSIVLMISGRRFMSDLRDAHTKDFIEKLPHFNSIFNYLENPELTPVLHAMIPQPGLRRSLRPFGDLCQ